MFQNAVVEALNAKFGDKALFEIVPGGRKNIKIAKRDLGLDGKPVQGGRSVVMFIDAQTGAFYKAAGWKAPAAGIRFAPQTEAEAVALIKDVADLHGSWLYIR